MKKLYFQIPILIFIFLILIVNLGDRLILDPPFAHEEMRTILKYIKHNWQQNDKILVFDSAKTAFKYYNNFLDLKKMNIMKYQLKTILLNILLNRDIGCFFPILIMKE